MDSVFREVNAKVLGRELSMISQGGKRLRVNQLLYADDTVLLGNSKESIQ